MHRFDPQLLDFGIVRYDRLGVGPFDTLSARGSYNRQQDDRTTQSINNSRQGLLSPILAEKNATTAMGGVFNVARSRHARHRLSAGLEVYDEQVASTRLDSSFNASTGAFTTVTAARGRYPDGASYQTLGTYAAYEWVPVLDRLTVAASARYSWSVTTDLFVSALVSRGFRAPNVTDRGTIGLSGNGFEVPPEEAVRLGASVTPFGAALGGPTQPAQSLSPERLWNYELGVQYGRGPFSARGAAFRSDLFDLIERKVVVLPPGAVGSSIGGEDVATGRPPGLENGIPPLHGAAFVRWHAPERRWWAQTSLFFAGSQGQLSANDLAQARIGGFRTASGLDVSGPRPWRSTIWVTRTTVSWVLASMAPAATCAWSRPSCSEMRRLGSVRPWARRCKHRLCQPPTLPTETRCPFWARRQAPCSTSASCRSAPS